MLTLFIRAAAMLLLAALSMSVEPSKPNWVTGDWRGTLDLGAQQLEIVYHLEADSGSIVGTMDVPTQGAAGLELQSVRLEGDQLTIWMPLAGEARYDGEHQGGIIKGKFTQSGQSFPLTLRLAESAARPARPQEPDGPPPYQVEQVTFNGAGGTSLAGTLTLPGSADSFPGVVLVAGAGPHDRDGSFMNHRPLLVLADRLARAGFAVLRFDERGVGESKGDFAAATAGQLAGDVAAGLDFLRRRESVDATRVGIVAHSEGGRISALAIETHDATDFVVFLGAPARPGIEGLRAQADQSPNAVAGLQLAMAEAALQSEPGANADKALREAAREFLEALPDEQRATFGGQEPAIIDQLSQGLAQSQARFALAYDPRPALRQSGIPVLALYGGKDQQIDAADAAHSWQAELGSDARIETLPGLNHFFQEAQTGAHSEYAVIEQTVAPQAMDTIINWLTAVNLKQR